MSNGGSDPYQEKHFTDRIEEVNLVIQQATRMDQDGRTGQVVRFVGPKGAGKSWLLCKIVRQLREKKWIVCHVILGQDRPCEEPLYLPSDETEKTPDSALRRTLEYVAQTAGISASLPSPNDEAADTLIGMLEDAGRLLILLVDGVDECAAEFLEELDGRVLTLLINKTNTLVVLGGRLKDPREHNWSSALRGGLVVDLKPFPPQDTTDQFGRLGLKAPADEIVKRGGGYPLTNRRLAEEWPSGVPQALKRCADEHLSEVSEDLRPYLLALCVLKDGFMVDHMPSLLQAYASCQVPGLPALSSADSWSFDMCATSLSKISNSTRLVVWDTKKDTYTIDEAVRRLLEAALKENAADCWRTLHQEAYKLSAEWAGKWSQYEAQRDYHRAVLEDQK